VLSEIREVLRDRFGIDHVTVQVETDGMERHPVCE
jgi:Co/Zn/Cd efflux system component